MKIDLFGFLVTLLIGVTLYFAGIGANIIVIGG
nr:MAG: hypothetical protein [Microvirus Sku111]